MELVRNSYVNITLLEYPYIYLHMELLFFIVDLCYFPHLRMLSGNIT